MPLEKNSRELKQIGQRIREARERSKLTREELARKIGKTPDSISRYETGTRALNLTELPLLAKALHMPMEYFFSEDPKSSAIRTYRMAHYLVESEPEEIQRIMVEIVKFLTINDDQLATDNEIAIGFNRKNVHYEASLIHLMDTPQRSQDYQENFDQRRSDGLNDILDDEP